MLELLHRCLGSRQLGPRVRRRAALVALALLGYDAGYGDLLGLAAAPTPEALAADREVIAAWKAGHRTARSRGAGAGGGGGGGVNFSKLDRPGFPAVFLPRPRDCSHAELRTALVQQGLEHRHAFGTRTRVLQTLLDALFQPDTTTAMRLLCVIAVREVLRRSVHRRSRVQTSVSRRSSDEDTVCDTARVVMRLTA